MAEERSIRSVFVGNIPYEATEEQLKEIFSRVGPVVSFRLVYDRETAKPKGYGFCEYQDQETAQSAMRNLNNFEIGGRPLRVGVAAGDQAKEEAKAMQQSFGGPIPEIPYGEPVEPEKAPEAISRAVASLPPEQMFELMKQMKLCIQNNPNEARSMLLQNAQLAYALLQGQIVMKIVDPQVALAMLHRPAEQIPPLIPTSTPHPVEDIPPQKPIFNEKLSPGLSPNEFGPRNAGGMPRLRGGLLGDMPPQGSRLMAPPFPGEVRGLERPDLSMNEPRIAIPPPVFGTRNEARESREGPGMGRQGPDMGRQGPDMGRQGPDMGRPGPDMGRQGPDMGRPGPDMGRPGPDMGRPGPDMGRQGPDMGRQGLDMGRQGPDMGRQGPDMGRPGPDMGRPGSDMGRQGLDMGRQGLDMGRPGPDMGRQGLDIGRQGLDMGRQDMMNERRDIRTADMGPPNKRLRPDLPGPRGPNFGPPRGMGGPRGGDMRSMDGPRPLMEPQFGEDRYREGRGANNMGPRGFRSPRGMDGGYDSAEGGRGFEPGYRGVDMGRDMDNMRGSEPGMRHHLGPPQQNLESRDTDLRSRPGPGFPPTTAPSSRPNQEPPNNQNVSVQDQEKAALIMQVLQLSDEQIAILPPDQRQSILILKEQIASARGGNSSN